MIICILATNENVEEVRAKGIEVLPQFSGHRLLGTPVSPTGLMPPTHWFCSFSVTPETFEKLMAVKNLSEMEESSSKSFLKERNLKQIRRLDV